MFATEQSSSCRVQTIFKFYYRILSFIKKRFLSWLTRSFCGFAFVCLLSANNERNNAYAQGFTSCISGIHYHQTEYLCHFCPSALTLNHLLLCSTLFAQCGACTSIRAEMFLVFNIDIYTHCHMWGICEALPDSFCSMDCWRFINSGEYWTIVTFESNFTKIYEHLTYIVKHKVNGCIHFHGLFSFNDPQRSIEKRDFLETREDSNLLWLCLWWNHRCYGFKHIFSLSFLCCITDNGV